MNWYKIIKYGMMVGSWVCFFTYTFTYNQIWLYLIPVLLIIAISVEPIIVWREKNAAKQKN